jgi:hypothetical protein
MEASWITCSGHNSVTLVDAALPDEVASVKGPGGALVVEGEGGGKEWRRRGGGRAWFGQTASPIVGEAIGDVFEDEAVVGP